MSVPMRLTYAQISIASMVATMRHVNNRKHGRPQRYGMTKFVWDAEIESCCAEMAVAALLNLYWDGGTLNCYTERDVGGIVDVRWTDRANGRLILHKDDPDDVPFVLVTGTNGAYTIVGWLFARDGKRDEYWCDPTGEGRPAYFVPQKALRPVSEIDIGLPRLRAA